MRNVAATCDGWRSTWGMPVEAHVPSKSWLKGSITLKCKSILAAAILASSTLPAFADCTANEKVEVLRELKTNFLTGDYDAFFAASDPAEAIPDNVEHDTKVQLIQYIGVPVKCMDMVRKRYSDNFETLVSVFLGRDNQMVFLVFSVLKVDDEHQILGVQLSTDYNEIFQYVR
ncbi:hypothetical protein KQ247_11100 [Ruegeria pomeroyi]|uniref:hypothetical protein n=1 Tax=Ruegeria pomeroyi TaxID=89184 RepID=UPI001840B4FD|nr:hypothetical protein [Ruegeria pomeroyi]NVL01828.1 hypothetical protein [Ruegeria pomeroyi]QWV07395.1 hypothetical protein KQ247_11100 [Ruegeria pomeroyi]